MHLELPSESSLVTFHTDEIVDISGEEVNVGPLPDRDYFAFMTDDPDDIVWSDFGDLTKGYGHDSPSSSGPEGPSGSKA